MHMCRQVLVHECVTGATIMIVLYAYSQAPHSSTLTPVQVQQVHSPRSPIDIPQPNGGHDWHANAETDVATFHPPNH